MSSSAPPVESVLKTKGYGTGRRKNAVARVFIRPGSGKFEVNGRAVDYYFKNVAWLTRAVEPLKFTNTASELDVMATVNGGGVGGQSGAVRMGLSRALSIVESRSAPRAAEEWFPDARFAHARTQEVRAEGRAQALPVQQALTRLQPALRRAEYMAGGMPARGCSAFRSGNAPWRPQASKSKRRSVGS